MRGGRYYWHWMVVIALMSLVLAAWRSPERRHSVHDAARIIREFVQDVFVDGPQREKVRRWNEEQREIGERVDRIKTRASRWSR